MAHATDSICESGLIPFCVQQVKPRSDGKPGALMCMAK